MHLPGAVSPLTREMVTGEPRGGTVLAAFPTALYLRVDGGVGVDRVLPVVTADALLLPTAVRLGVSSTVVHWPVAPGARVVIGGGRVCGSGLEVRAVRAWRPDRVRSGQPFPVAGVGLLPPGDVLGNGCAAIARAALTGRPVERQVGALVGAGQGLTPSGDDALCGVLLALRAWGPSGAALAEVAEAVDRSLHRTTDLSAALLSAAADGYCVPQVAALLAALVTVGPSDPAVEQEVARRFGAVLAIGHSSGGDLVAGLSGVLRALTSPSQRGQRVASRRVERPM
ncbi:DUF2877 domain-containing protein [Intrasporangium sp.]|uniref:oxamate carbamoyltransferase subunit AllH family protein n=1 Tax=Intrasporangium sp. TaxID=1925024 RepID=UPI003221BCCC